MGQVHPAPTRLLWIGKRVGVLLGGHLRTCAKWWEPTLRQRRGWPGSFSMLVVIATAVLAAKPYPSTGSSLSLIPFGE